MGGIIFLLVLIVFVAIIAYRSIKVVKQSEVYIIERLGKFHKVADAGLTVIFPFVDHVRSVVSLKQQTMDIPPQGVITQDNVTITIDTVVFYQITDPAKAVYEIQSLKKGIEYLAITTIRDIVGKMSLDETFSSRDLINQKLRSILDDATDKWGCKIDRVEIKDINPPDDIRDAMEKQMNAERNKRALILESEAQRQSAITIAEGKKQASILEAEADKEAKIRRAAGEAQAIKAVAEAKAKEIALVYDAIKKADPDEKLVQLKSLEALEKVADGEANKVLTADHAYKIGRYLGWYYNQNHRGRIIIGKDTRRSSYMFEYALVAGITASGADAFLLHVTTTPSVAYVVRTENFDCGIMVSASHNPYYDNGIKVMDGNGHKISAEVEAALEKYIDGEMGELPFALRDKVGVARDYAIGRNRYIGYLISLATRSYDGMRVGLDCSNGSTFNIAKSVFDALGAKTYVVGNEPDGTNINMGCGSTHIENLQRLVREKNLDCGFAFDGDADRCIAVDENGMEVHGDYILYVCGKYLKECGRLQNNTVVATIMSNMGLFKAMKREGIEVCVTTVGDKYVNEAMVANGYVLGGEQSGHIIFSKHATTGDGILTALMLMEVILEKKQSLGTLCKGMQMYPQLLKNVRVEDKAAVTGNARVQVEKDRISAALGEDGRILLRESGTEPVIRVMVEAQSDELCAKYVDEMVQVIREEGLAVE